MSDFEDRLHSWGTTEAAATGPAPAFRGRPKRRWLPAAAAAAVVLVVGGVGAAVVGEGDDRAVRPISSVPPADVVPWADLAAGPVVTQAPSPTPPISAPDCAGHDLSLQLGAGDGLTGGQVLQQVVVRTSRACHLDAPVTAMSGVVSGHRVAFPVGQDRFPGGTPGVITPRSPGSLNLTFNLSCEGEQPVPPTRDVTGVRLTLLGSVLDVAPGGQLGAGHPEPGTLSFCSRTIGVTRAEAAPPMPSYLPLPLAALVATIQAPSTARAGADLDYLVTLTNPTSTAIPLEPCPSYVESTDHAKGVHRLNCEQAHAVPANGSETFAMRLHLDDDTVSGSTRLVWGLSLVVEGRAPATVITDLTVVDGQDPFAGHVACTPSSTELPCVAGMESMHAYPYRLYTHCGLRSLYADGRYWIPDGKVDAGDGNAPSKYDNPEDPGFVTLMKPEWLQFESRQHVLSNWVPGRPPGEVCS
jgi:hypothetical protein